MYKIKERLNITGDYGLNYLASFGVLDPASYVRGGSKKDATSPYTLKRMRETIEVLRKGFTEDKTFFVQIDSDCDGYSSAAIFVSYFRDRYPNAKILWGVHPGKEHGIVLDTVPIAADYIIIPDAGSNDIDQQNTLAEQGRTVVVLDHHYCPVVNDHANVYIVNNQLSDGANKDLSGAGVVYKTIQAYDELYFDGALYEKYADLAMLGIIADMMDSTKADTNYIINYGLNHIKNPFILALEQRRAYQLKYGLTKVSVAYYIAPVINGVVRSGTQEEKETMFRAMSSDPTSNFVETIYRGKKRTEDYYSYAARICDNAKGRQDSLKKKLTEKAIEIIEKNKLYENKIIILNLEDLKEDLPKTMTGILAMSLNREYGNPVLVVRPKVEDGIKTLSGSGRGQKALGFGSLLGFLKDSKLMDSCEGHAMAHGVGFREDRLADITAYANEKLKDVDFSIPELEVEAHLEDE